MGRVSQKNLAIEYPYLIEEWNIKNLQSPFELAPFSNKKVWWICKKGHEWESIICNRTGKNKTGCPYCSGNLVTQEYNLAIKFPNLLQEWDYKKNLVKPETLHPKSSKKKVWWICSKGHEWQATPAHRTEGKRCPYCFGDLASVDYNLVIKYPELIKEWNFDKNEFLPETYLPKSNKVVWWICSKNLKHEWKTAIGNRTGELEAGCPYCCNIDSKLELFTKNKLNLDIYNYCPLIKSKIKYKPDFQLSNKLYLNTDGLYWHSELIKEIDYHFKLREAFELENKRILQFYEDEIYNKWSIIESIINNSIGNSNKIFARKCEIKQVVPSIANNFYNQNHLMGHFASAKHYGLYLDQELVSIISIRNLGEFIEISRFCNKLNISVIGGFQKLLSYVIKLYQPKQIISYCDLRYATGNSYIKAGFKLEHVTQGWCWTDKYKRYNRLYCKAGNGKTERENAQVQGLVKLYDAGQAKYVLDL